MKIIFLIGMPACGKTYWAKQLSEYYGIPYKDLDSEIEMLSGKTIPTIFSEEGEDSFRLLEHTTLKQIINNNSTPLIIACGGGTPIYHNNITLMRYAGCVVYIKASIEVLYNRILQDKSVRPLVQSNDLKGRLSALFEERKYIYESADYIIDVTEDSVSNFEEIIRSCTSRH